MGSGERREFDVIRDLEETNLRLTRGYQLKEGLREILRMPLFAARRALTEWLAWPRSGPHLALP